MKLFGHEVREAWFAKDINGVTWPSAISSGHALTLTNGAYKATTTRGLVMRGAELVTITDPAALAIVNNLTIVFPTFVLDTLFSSASAADMGLFNFNNGSVVADLNSTTGALDILCKGADGAADEIVSTTKVSWAAETEWQVAMTFAKQTEATISVRLYINGVAEATNAHCDTDLTDGAGDTIYGYDGTTYFTGRITRGPRVYSTTVLSAAELLLLYKGVEEASNLVLQHNIDEGRGTAIDDKATGAACDGLISGTNAASVWDYVTVKQPCMGQDGIDSYAVSGAVVSIRNPVTLVDIVKMKSTYSALGADHRLCQIRSDANNGLLIVYENSSDVLRFEATGTGTSKTIDYSTKPTIGDVWVIVCTVSSDGATAYYVNGASVGTNTSLPDISGTLATLYLGASYVPSQYDASVHLGLALLDGALTVAQAKQLSADVDKWLGLGLSI